MRVRMCARAFLHVCVCVCVCVCVRERESVWCDWCALKTLLKWISGHLREGFRAEINGDSVQNDLRPAAGSQTADHGEINTYNQC